MLTALVLSLPAHAEPRAGFSLRPEVVLDLANDRRTFNGSGPAEDPLTVHTWLRAFVENETPRGDLWFGEARVQHHVLAGKDLEAWYELGLGETGADLRLGGASSPARLRIGVLRERWGKTDLLPVLDVLNPRDARIGPLTPPEFRGLPLPMARLSLSHGKFRSETTLIPFAGADRLWLRDTDWSLIRQDMPSAFIQTEVNDRQDPWTSPTTGIDETVGNLLGSVLTNLGELDPTLRRAQDRSTNLDGLPQALFANGALAQRLEVELGQVDVAVVGGLLRSTFPQAVLDAPIRTLLQEERLPADYGELTEVQEAVLVGTPLDVTWPRTAMVGAEGAGLLGEVQVRAEAGYWTDRVVRTAFGQSQTVPATAAALGLDYVRGSELQVALEARWQHLFDAPEDLVLARADQVQVALALRAGLLRERLRLQVTAAYDLTFQELLARPTLSWGVADGVRLELGGVFLEGFATDPPEGLLDALTYEGGPASYWSQNDSVTLAVTLDL